MSGVPGPRGDTTRRVSHGHVDNLNWRFFLHGSTPCNRQLWLDEVNYEGGRHERTTQAIRDFAQQYGKSRMVITCRTAATEYTFEQFTYMARRVLRHRNASRCPPPSFGSTIRPIPRGRRCGYVA